MSRAGGLRSERLAADRDTVLAAVTKAVVRSRKHA
jgi:hypothetical protein